MILLILRGPVNFIAFSSIIHFTYSYIHHLTFNTVPNIHLLPPAEFNNALPWFWRSLSGKTHKWVIVIAVLSAVALLSVITLIIILLRRKRPEEKVTEDAKHVSKAMSITNRAFSSQGQCKENTEGQPGVNSLECCTFHKNFLTPE